MSSATMNKTLGTKWFTFYTKVRPVITCLSIFTVITDFVKYQDVYINNWWLLLMLFGSITQAILCIIVLVKSCGDYIEFVSFVKGVLLFETINMAFQQGVQQYLNSGLQVSVAVIACVVTLVIGYLVWYRLNRKYFEKRINVNIIVRHKQEVITENSKVCFCRKCGEKLIDDSKFCSKCGTEIVEM